MTVFVAIGASGAKGLKDMRALPAALPHPVNAILLLVLHRVSAEPSGENSPSSESSMPMQARFYSENVEVRWHDRRVGGRDHATYATFRRVAGHSRRGAYLLRAAALAGVDVELIRPHSMLPGTHEAYREKGLHLTAALRGPAFRE